MLPDGYMTIGFQDDAWLATYDHRDTLISTIPYPDFRVYEDMPPHIIATFHDYAYVAVSPDEHHIVCSHNNGSYIFFGAIERGNALRTIRRWNYQEPTIETHVINGRSITATTGSSLLGMASVTCTNEYVYAIYSGKNRNEYGLYGAEQGTHLLVYDWDGNPVRQYLLEKPLRTFGYDEANATIYGIGYDPEGVLIEYKVGE
jgi:hypothetical protein